MSVAMDDWPRRHRISVDDYHRMAEVGLLAPDARVELIEGEIVEMPPIGSRHGAAVSQLNALLVRAVGERALVRCQLPVRLGDLSEPQPDLALVAHRDDFYAQHHPVAADTFLAIEVSESTLRYDRQVKMALYARHGIPELWIVDVKDKRLLVFRQPSGSEYREVLTVTDKPAVMAIASLPEVSVDLSALV